MRLLLDVLAFRHRRLRCWLFGGHTFTDMTDPIACLWCSTRGYPT